jgi:CheY-like chemotaxis protein
MDIQLPDIDGLEATKAIRNLECGMPALWNAKPIPLGRNKIEEGPYSESEIPGPDLADQDDVMEKEVWEASKSNGISKSTRARAGRNQKSKIKKVPIIALTSYAMVGDREKALEAGCTGYIEKPINPETFIAEMEKFLVNT